MTLRRRLGKTACHGLALVACGVGLACGIGVAPPAGACGFDYEDGLPRDNWRNQMALFATSVDGKAPAAAYLAGGVKGLTAELDAVDPIKPGRIDAFLPGLVNTYQSAFNGVKVCADEAQRATGVAYLPAGSLAQWNDTLEAKVRDFFRIFGKQWAEREITHPLMSSNSLDPANVNVRLIQSSPALRRALKAADPALLATADATFHDRVAMRDADTAEDDRLTGIFARDVLIADRAAKGRPAVLKTLPSAVGGWTRAGDMTYRRQGPAGVTMEMSCGADTGRGLLLTFTRTGGEFYYVNDLVFSETDGGADLTIDGKTVRSRLRLKFERQETHHAIDTDNHEMDNLWQTHREFNSQVATLSFQDVDEYRSDIRSLWANANAGDTGRQINPWMTRGDTRTEAQKDSDAALANIDIDSLKKAKSIQLKITVLEPHQGARWIEMGEILPQQAPFSSLMQACNGGWQ